MKKCFSFFLALVLCVSLVTPAFATEPSKHFYDNTPANYVQELVDLSDDDIDALSSADVVRLFTLAFDNVPTSLFSESEMRSIISALSYGLKWTSNRVSQRSSSVSTSSSHYYNGNKGIAWIRDTDKSPFTLGELAGGFYSLEYDFITPETIYSIIAAGTSKTNFEKLADAVLSNVSSDQMTSIIKKILISAGISLSGSIPLIATSVVSTILGFGYTWVSTADRDSLLKMAQTATNSQYIRIEFMYNQNSNMVTRIATYVSRGNLANPSSDKYGFWYPGQYAINYSYGL